MTVPEKDAGLFHGYGATETATLYEDLGGLLQRTLMRTFGLPRADAESLVYETFIVYSGLDVPPADARAWLIGAACKSANAYLQSRGLTADAADPTRETERSLRYHEALGRLPVAAREALRLRFAEGKSYAEIAAELDITVDAAERIVRKAAGKMRQLL